jgi:hypothetical protein
MVLEQTIHNALLALLRQRREQKRKMNKGDDYSRPGRAELPRSLAFCCCFRLVSPSIHGQVFQTA